MDNNFPYISKARVFRRSRPLMDDHKSEKCRFYDAVPTIHAAEQLQDRFGVDLTIQECIELLTKIGKEHSWVKNPWEFMTRDGVASDSWVCRCGPYKLIRVDKTIVTVAENERYYEHLKEHKTYRNGKVVEKA